MSHDSHSDHAASDAAEIVEPAPIPLAPPRNYLWPLGLSLIVAALLIYLLLFYPNGGNLSDPPAPPGQQNGMTTLTVTATAEPSAVALSNPSPTRPAATTAVAAPTSTIMPVPLTAAPSVAVSTLGPTATPSVALTASASVPASATISPTPAPIATLPVAAPSSLQLGNASFAVEAASEVTPTWKFDPDPTRASWLPTTALPYVIGIPYSAANAALFAAAKPDQVVTMQNSANSTLRFKINTVARVKPDDTSSGTHLGEGLVLYLLADPASDRAMISATFLDASGGAAAP